jgi:tripartite-type tricarboxylate transporter receptor subunit TctC
MGARLAAAAAMLLAGTAGIADASDAPPFPGKPIRLLVGFPPGGGNDALARLIGPRLSEKLGAAIVIDNRPGAGGNLAAEMTARAPADGYTILIASSSHPIQGLLKKALPYDPIRDFAGVAELVVYRSLLVSYPGLPATTVKEVIALAKAKPGQLNFISSGNGTGSHLAGELFKVATKTDMTHIAYKGGGAALVDLSAGRVDMMFSPLVPVLPHLKSGRLRPIAVTSVNRSRLMPELPTIAEAGVPGYEFVSWYGLLAPAGTPRPVVARLNAASNDVMRLPEVTESVQSEDMDAVSKNPQQFDDVRKAMIVKWTQIIRRTGIAGSE